MNQHHERACVGPGTRILEVSHQAIAAAVLHFEGESLRGVAPESDDTRADGVPNGLQVRSPPGGPGPEGLEGNEAQSAQDPIQARHAGAATMRSASTR